MRTEDIPLDRLLLDPNNYRLQELAGFTAYPEERFHLEAVQRTTLQRLQKEALKELQNSILANGFLPIERIVVTPYTHADGHYLVIEGNRRVAALKSIKAQADAGIEIPQNVEDVFDAVPCIIPDEDQADFPYFKETLMGIRHVGGIRQWGGYQRAKLIADLRDVHGVEATDVADRLGLSVQEVNRRYRALRALQQMQESEDYGEYATPSMYPLFHEAVSLPAVRSWLGWNQVSGTFDNDEERETFYKLITPRIGDEGGGERSPKLGSYSDVRELKHIIGNREATNYLLDDDKDLISALAVAKQDHIAKKWRSEITEAKSALEKISAIEVDGWDSADFAVIEELIATAQKVLDIRRTLSGN
ncbi:MAG: hypothetical protein EBR82_16090 [Caulobacteraceae bacterium]|nr:hypothetical protein [Caulobacteraceae bacterium]